MPSEKRFGQVLEVYRGHKHDTIAIWDLERKLRFHSYPKQKTGLASRDVITFCLDDQGKLAQDVCKIKRTELPKHLRLLF